MWAYHCRWLYQSQLYFYANTTLFQGKPSFEVYITIFYLSKSSKGSPSMMGILIHLKPCCLAISSFHYDFFLSSFGKESFLIGYTASIAVMNDVSSILLFIYVPPITCIHFVVSLFCQRT